jgi:hypothetical protein
MFSFICNWSHCAFNEWRIVYRFLEEISNDWCLNTFVKKRTH